MCDFVIFQCLLSPVAVLTQIDIGALQTTIPVLERERGRERERERERERKRKQSISSNFNRVNLPEANDWKCLAFGTLCFMLHSLGSSQSVKGGQPNQTNRFFEHPV